jgi:4'-phosphopantetheinyl transferase
VTQFELRLGGDELQVWRASLEPEPHSVAYLERLLAEDERKRAEKFHFERDRRRFVVGRGILRTLLGGYLGEDPRALRFRYGERGKPGVPGGPFFNISHSGPLMLLAFSPSTPVGIDVELSQPHLADERVAEHFFSPAEVASLRSLPPERQAHAFLACWTRKEAFIKARGDGLSLALDSFDVSFGPERPCELLRTGWSTDEAKHWRLADLSDPAGTYIAAVAARGLDWQLATRRLHTRRPVHEGSLIAA